ncbi:hypothetical protein HQ560_06560, partial [bacterium]|nr:hypothetical protein [bacterium]
MRSRLFAIIMGTASVIALFVALPIVAKLQTRRTQRDTYAEAFDQAKSSPSQALGAIERCLEFRPDDLDLHRLGASVALRVGDAALAEKYFAPLLEKAEPPFPAQAHLSLGALYFSGGAKTTPDPSRAIEHFLACLRLDKSQVMATTGIAFAFASQGKLKEATPYLQKVASLPSSAALGQYASTARLWLFSDMFENGDPLACWVAFRRLDLAPSVKGKYERPLKAAVAAKVNSPGISSAVRRVSLLALRDLLRDSATTAAQKLVLNTLMADACDRIGDEAAALTRYRAAYDIDASNDTAARNVAFALLRASQRARRARGHKPKDGLNDFDTAVTIYKDLLTAGKLDEKERRQVVLA